MLTLIQMPTSPQLDVDNVNAIRVKCPAKPWFGSTWPKFRFAERDISARWLPVAAVSDSELVTHGFRLGSQIRDASPLAKDHQIELANLLGRHGEELSVDEKGRLSALLECCPFCDNLPPIDIDPQAEDVTQEELRQVANTISAAWEAQGLGGISWFSTGGRGLHGEIVPPNGLASPYLMRAYGTLVRRTAAVAGYPVLTAHRSKQDRPRILIDDSLFDRDSTGRDGLWRLVGAPHTKTGRPKRAIIVNAGWAKAPHDATDVESAIKSVESQAERYGSGVRHKPRNPSDLNGLPKPHAQLLGRGALKRTAEVIERCTRRGANHDLRKALAGWLLREGVPTTVAAATIAAAGDAEDAAGVVRTTAERMMSGRKAFGFRKLSQLVGTMGVMEFQAALTLDLEDAEITPRDLSRFLSASERQTLHEAAEIAARAGNQTRALTCRRAARCGLAKENEVCKSCGDVEGVRNIVAERPTCPHCANRRATAILNWCIRRWPETRVQCITRNLPDHSLEFARAQRRYWSRRVPGKYRGKIRWIIAPGWLVAITAHDETGYFLHGSWTHLEGWNDHRRDGRGNFLGHLALLKVLRPVLAARAAHLRRYLRLGDAEGLAADAWLEKVMEASGGKHAREKLPWPKLPDLRRDAINDRRIRNNLDPLEPGQPLPSIAERGSKRTTCCQSRIDYTLIDAKDRQTIAVRDDRPWLFSEAGVRAEAGWRGERMEFDDHGRLLRLVQPPGFDVNRLIE